MSLQTEQRLPSFLSSAASLASWEAETLEGRARLFAEGHELTRGACSPTSFYRDLTILEKTLAQEQRRFLESADLRLKASHAAEWLLDNYFIIQQAIQHIRKDMSPSFYRQLPVIRSPAYGKTPRLSVLAEIVVQSCQFQLDLDRLARFVCAFQEVKPLTLAELWALPVMLRVALLQSLATVLAHLAELTHLAEVPLSRTTQRGRAKLWRALRGPVDLSSGRVGEGVLGGSSMVSLAILSLRALDTWKWQEQVEAFSVVDQILRQDPLGVYPDMDFETRDQYRRAVENLSRMAGSRMAGQSEPEVARRVVQLAVIASGTGKSKAARGRPGAEFRQGSLEAEGDRQPEAHVGYYLVDDGLPALEKSLQIGLPWRERLRRALRRYPTLVYLGGIFSLTALILGLGLAYLAELAHLALSRTPSQPWNFWAPCLLLLTGVVPAISFAIGLMNWMLTRFLPPRRLPRLDFKGGIPPGFRTLLVIPCLFSSQEDVDADLKQLELHFLRSGSPKAGRDNPFFALLSDFSDAPQETMQADAPLLERAVLGIQRLNERYGVQTSESAPGPGSSSSEGPFMLLHRSRRWNPAEECWMGWERKRGKLDQLNQFLLGKADPFSLKAGNLRGLENVRYVITLDSDTRLTYGAPQKLAATLAHPLNQAHFAPGSADGRLRLQRGYTILQPRLQTRFTEAHQTWFTRIFAYGRGIDPYTHAVSDLYQDLFGEGLYVGKGIYEVHSFEATLRGRVPENALLSHDLFEGIHGRVGLVTDILFFEDYPANYLEDTYRRHRWARGDWQLLPWLLPRVPTQSGRQETNSLSFISRWKILDNLRRTLMPVMLMAFFLLGWLGFEGNHWVWTAAGFIFLSAPILTNLIPSLDLRGKRQPHLDSDTWLLRLAQSLLLLAFLPYEAFIMLDAILTTWFRLFISHKRLLQWRTMAHTILFLGVGRRMALIWSRVGWVSLWTALLAGLVFALRPAALAAAAPVLWVWASSPLAAYAVSRTLTAQKVDIGPAQHYKLRRVACRTWLFFEHMMTPEGNWLPPDHFQEYPVGRVVHHTSPTNIGMMLASILAAYDLGYISLISLKLRVDFAMERLVKMERHRGHFLNWVETTSLRPLTPRYVSTVDSGNLAACFWILAEGMREMASRPLLRWQNLQGLMDLLDALDEHLEMARFGDQRQVAARLIQQHLLEMRQRVLAQRDQPLTWPKLIKELRSQSCARLSQLVGDLLETTISNTRQLDAQVFTGLRTWAGRITYHMDILQYDLHELLPWVESLQSPPPILTRLQNQATWPEDIGNLWQALQSLWRPELTLGQIPDTVGQGLALLDKLEAALGVLSTTTEGALGTHPTYEDATEGALGTQRTTEGALGTQRTYEDAAEGALGTQRTYEDAAEGALRTHPTYEDAAEGALGTHPTYEDATEGALRTHPTYEDATEGALRTHPTFEGIEVDATDLEWFRTLRTQLENSALHASESLDDFQSLGVRFDQLVQDMDFRFLYDPNRDVFHIGYNLEVERLDANYYDLLASEARLASYVAIVKGDVPQRHWMALARPLTWVGGAWLHGAYALLSWSGTMFEYLMPALFLKSFPETLVDQTYRAVARHQIAYGKKLHLPWGISEAGFYFFDAHQNYQYKAFGVPGLGFKRGLEQDRVITPHACLLALPYAPQAVVENLAHLDALGALGPYGYYESLDFTPARMTAGVKYQRVRSYYAHHQGMILLALANYLQDNVMVRRFHSLPPVRSAELLLQEGSPQRSSRKVVVVKPHQETLPAGRLMKPARSLEPWLPDLQSPIPQVHLLSNGHWQTLITQHGGGYAAWNGRAAAGGAGQPRFLTRWRADTTCDSWGVWIYCHDIERNQTWSLTPYPSDLGLADLSLRGGKPEQYQVIYQPHCAEFKCENEGLVSRMRIFVLPEEDLEVRQITLTNPGNETRRLFLASYGEVVLGIPGDDLRHPAFQKLFLECSYLEDSHTLLYRRRPRSAGEEPVFLAHAVCGMAPGVPVVWLTDRSQFLERGGSLRSPAGLRRMGQGQPQATTNPAATGLDPIFSLGVRIDIPPRQTVELAYLTAAAASEAVVLASIQQGVKEGPDASGWPTGAASFSGASPQLQQAYAFMEQEMQKLEVDSAQLALAQALLSGLLYPHAWRRAAAQTLAANCLGQEGLWKHAISGDYPILLVEIENEQESGLVREVLKIHAAWRNFNFPVDLVLLNLRDSGYYQDLHQTLLSLLNETGASPWLNARGGIFLLDVSQIMEERILLETAAGVILYGARGSLADQLAERPTQAARLPDFVPMQEPFTYDLPAPVPRPVGWQFDNGWGGFSPEGREYQIYLQPGERTPAPWINVVANPHFGFIISEMGGGYTWAENSGENRLTPWRNDPLLDTPGEALYLRDEETGEVWSPTPLPVRANAPYLIRHGQGYTIFEHHSHGLKQALRLFVPLDAPVKIIQLTLENPLERARRVSVTCYVEWVLGTTRSASQPYIITEFDSSHYALLATNPYQPSFSQHTAFLASTREPAAMTASRVEFLGLGGDLEQPAALKRVALGARVGAGLDPCAALQNQLWLAPGETKQVTFLLGQESDRQTALERIAGFQEIPRIEQAWLDNLAFWEQTLSAVQVQTPEPAMDLLLNRWLLYQALSCRVWGRSALYQSSGAFGFRDQLQDVLCLLHSAPHLARQHLLEAASHQFEAGDVLHWWHPPSGRGVRTRCSDDLLWLPYVTAQYIQHTGDLDVLQEEIPFLAGEPLAQGEQERYQHWSHVESDSVADAPNSLWEHCLRALQKGNTRGPHGLPLMGSHDWNDGFNRVGHEGRGESVWNAWFLISIFQQWAALCEKRGDTERALTYRQQAEELARAVESQAWDGGEYTGAGYTGGESTGEWYLRAYYDDGTPLGSSESLEAKIDSLAQSWAVLSGMADPDRALLAMEAVDRYLVRRPGQTSSSGTPTGGTPIESTPTGGTSPSGLVLLFTPPFDQTLHDPGYIKGYQPGIRENGGQYTHAACWVGFALAELGLGERAEELFRLLNPILHACSPEQVALYRVEPYVIAADVYSMPPYVGRGGWTWYTGSASWMYRLGVEAILGLRRQGDYLILDPCIPPHWPSYSLTYRFGQAPSTSSGQALYRIEVQNPHGVCRGVARLLVDGQVCSGNFLLLDSNPGEHQVVVELGSSTRDVHPRP